MSTRDYRNIVAGATLIFIGAFAAIHATTTLNIGSIANMGPGMFPAALGMLLVAFGIVILIPAIFRPGTPVRLDLRSLIAVSLSIVAFAFLVRPFGLIPAVVVLTVIVSRADSKLSPLGTAIVAAVLSLGATLIFRVGLGMQISAINWPW